MALTPDDVLNKRFQTTKFRDGYDQDEVDDFLDEVVVEFRRLTDENQQLHDTLAQAQQRVEQLESEAANASPALSAPVPAEPQSTQQPLVAAVSPASTDEADSATNLLQLARKLHEEHVREGIERRDALISEGEAKAEQLVSEAEQQRKESLAAFEQEKSALEARIEELQSFERDYRTKLRSYIEGQLGELNSMDIN